MSVPLAVLTRKLQAKASTPNTRLPMFFQQILGKNPNF